MDYSPIFISLKTAMVSIFFTFFLGIFAAWGVVSIQDNKIRTIIDGILILPLVLPPTVAGFFLLQVFGLRGPVGNFFLEYFSVKIAFSWEATVIAAVVMSFPLMYRSARGAFEQVDENIIYAAKTLGMSEWKIFWRIRLALTLPGVAAGGILAYTRGLGEFGATAMLAGNIAGQTRTLPIAVYGAAMQSDDVLALKYVIVILIIAFIAITLMNYFTIKAYKLR